MATDYNPEGYTARELFQVLRCGIKAARCGELDQPGTGKWERKADKIREAALARKAGKR